MGLTSIFAKNTVGFRYTFHLLVKVSFRPDTFFVFHLLSFAKIQNKSGLLSFLLCVDKTLSHWSIELGAFIMVCDEW